jgi:predicted small secreted protein
MLMRIAGVLLLLSMLAACNTMEGLGKDVQKTGKKIEKAAERHK